MWQQIHNNAVQISNMLLIVNVFHLDDLWIFLCGAEKTNQTNRWSGQRYLLGTHLTSTSPPTCITNEPSGCFTDHRKSNSFSLEETERWFEKEEDVLCREERQRGGYESTEGDKDERKNRGRGGSAANLIKQLRLHGYKRQKMKRKTSNHLQMLS